MGKARGSAARWVRRGVVGVLVVAVGLLGVVEYALFKGKARMDRRIDITAYNITDTDVAALHQHLKSLPPRPAGNR